jgi:hypothetical protein
LIEKRDALTQQLSPERIALICIWRLAPKPGNR